MAFRKQTFSEAKRIIVTLLGIMLAISMIFPFAFMLSSSFKPTGLVFAYPIKLIPDSSIITIDNYVKVLSSRYDFARWYINTIYVSVLLLALKSIIVTVTGYSFARLRFVGREKLFLLFMMVMMIPGESTLIQRYVLYKYLNLTDSLMVLVIPAIFDVYFVFMMRQAFSVIPFELSEAGIIDGCSNWGVFYKIILPQVKPTIITMILFSFVWSWNDYATPFIFISDTKKTVLSVGIQTFQLTSDADFAVQMAGTTLTLVPILLLFLFLQKYFVKGLVSSGVKG